MDCFLGISMNNMPIYIPSAASLSSKPLSNPAPGESNKSSISPSVFSSFFFLFPPFHLLPHFTLNPYPPIKLSSPKIKAGSIVYTNQYDRLWVLTVG